MRLKLDENLSRHLKQPLAQAGHDASTAQDEGLLGKPDGAVASAAFAEGRMILTLDVGLADIRLHPPGRHPGIVLLRPPTLGVGTVERFVLEFARAHDLSALKGCVAIAEPGRVRIRRPER